MPLVWVALGGALGSVLRYLAQVRVSSLFPIPFPLGTLGVNLLGSALIGILASVFEAFPLTSFSAQMRTFLIIGILGGFTTFSSFSMESLNLLRAGEWKLGILYVAASNVFGLLLAWGGYEAGRLIFRAG